MDQNQLLGLMALRDGFGSLSAMGGGAAGPQTALPMALRYKAQQAEQEKLQQALQRAREGGGLPAGVNPAAFDAFASVAPGRALQVLASPEAQPDPWRGHKVVGSDVLGMGPNGPEVVYQGGQGDAPRPRIVTGPDNLPYYEGGQPVLPNVQAPAPPPDYSLADKIADNFRSEPAVKIFGDVQDAAARVAEFYSNPGSVSDYGLAVSFAKLVDPGSVAREGEVAAVQKSGALSQSMKQSLLNAFTGEGALPPQMRTEIANLAQKFYDVQASKYGKTWDDYSRRADRLGVSVDMALPTRPDPFSILQKQTENAANVWDGNREALQPGTRLQNPQTGEIVEWDGTAFNPVQ